MKGYKLLFLVAADNIIREDASFKPSFIGVFDVLRKPIGQHLIYSFYVGGKISIEKEEELTSVLSIVHADGTVIDHKKLIGRSTAGDVDIRGYFQLTKFDKPGRYYLRIEINGQKMEAVDSDRFYFEVIEAKPN